MNAPFSDDPRNLAARLTIADILHRYARGLDRLDMGLVRSCYHDDAMDHRPPLFSGPIASFILWVEPVLRGLEHSTHVISNILIDLDGADAGSECYWSATLRLKREGRLYDLVRSGRYLDRLTRRDGIWAIQKRQAITDWSYAREVDEPLLGRLLPNLKPDGLAGGDPSRDRNDPSYEFLNLKY